MCFGHTLPGCISESVGASAQIGFGYMHDACHIVASCVACVVHCCPACASHACKAVLKMTSLSVIQQDCSSAIKSLRFFPVVLLLQH